MTRHRIGNTTFILTSSVMALAAVSSIFASVHVWSRSHSAAAMAVSIVPTQAELETALIRAGLEPESLAAAGVTSNQVDGIVDDVRTWLTNNPTDLSAADAAYESARENSDQLRRTIQSGVGTGEDVTAYTSAMSNLQQAISDRDTALNAIFNAGTADLTQAIVDDLTVVRGNAGPWDYLSVEFLAKSGRTEAQWVDLREALADEHIADKYGESMDQDCQTLLTNERAHADVSAAITRLDSNLATVTSQWNQSVSE